MSKWIIDSQLQVQETLKSLPVRILLQSRRNLRNRGESKRKELLLLQQLRRKRLGQLKRRMR
jgi:hypothetical protein